MNRRNLLKTFIVSVLGLLFGKEDVTNLDDISWESLSSRTLSPSHIMLYNAVWTASDGTSGNCECETDKDGIITVNILK